jgi:hypothetical protein
VTNLVAFDGDRKAHKREEEILKLRENLPVILEAQKIVAEIARAKFNALVGQGFTAEQALELCK